MGHVIHLRCEQCGAPADASDPPWIRCTSCGSLVGFDFTSSAESPEYAEFMRRSMKDPQGYVKRWQDHDAAVVKAAQTFRKSPEKGLKLAAKAAEFLIDETPWAMPGGAKKDSDKREAYKLWLGFELMQHKLPGKYPDMQRRLNEAAAAIGFGANENPMPAFEKMLDVLREMNDERYRLGAPPDPEGLSREGRLRVTVSQMVAGYIRMVSPELQLELLRRIYGESAIGAVDISGQDYSVYFDWECPQCGLFSPQVPQADKLTCPGCYCARHVNFEPANAVSVICHGCGNRLDLAAGQLSDKCPYCTSQVKRFVRQGDAQRQVIAEYKQQIAKQHGFSYDEMMADSNGFGVTPENRLERLRDGLQRIAEWYHFGITPTRMAGFARASLPGEDLAKVDALLAEAQAAAERDIKGGHGSKPGLELLEMARQRLSRK
ncbi:MAG: hypothetical protein H6839_14340 [Planctomycetes bacterium]|nr:hypothetical protein [Planctomycetota bacterium]